MRFITRILLLVSLAATFAYSQTNNIPQVQHVIVVVQENRTPDNLFGSDAFATTHQLPGADLVQTGQCYTIPPPHTIQLQSITLKNSCDPDHSHGSWKNTYHGGYMDGACTVNTTTCTGYSTPPYTYVQSPDVVPYFQIATQYGYANYFFQTNQGPSLVTPATTTTPWRACSTSKSLRSVGSTTRRPGRRRQPLSGPRPTRLQASVG